MPFVNLPDALNTDFELLRQIPGEQGSVFFKQFCKLAQHAVISGTEEDASADHKMFAAAAGKIGGDATPDSVRRIVLGISQILIQSAKAGPLLSENDLTFSVTAVGFPSRYTSLLCQHFFLYASDIREHLRSTHNASIQRYTDLNWRLDVEVASRTRQNAVTPSFVLKLNTVSGSMGDVKNEQVMTCDFANMQHLHSELGAAVNALKSTRTMRVTRYLT